MAVFVTQRPNVTAAIAGFSAFHTGITTVLTLSTISLDSRTDLPKVRYATALDWFLLMSFFYCIATLLEFAGVHYFTKASTGVCRSLVRRKGSVFRSEVKKYEKKGKK